MNRTAIIAAALITVVIVVVAVVSQSTHTETGAEYAARVEAACRDAYTSSGPEAVGECQLRELGKWADAQEAAKQAAVDRAVNS